MARTSNKAQQILDYVEQFTYDNGYAPSVREIGVAVPKNARLTTPVKTFVDFISRYENGKQNQEKVVARDV